MAEDQSLQKLLDQLANLLKMAEEATQQPIKGPIPPDVQERLRMITGMVNYFKILNVKFFKDAGFSDDEIDHPKPPPVTPENEQERRLLERATQLDTRAKRGLDNLTASVKEAKTKKSAPKNRKKKFDRLGGRDKWKPM